MEGELFGGVPMNLELRLSVEDSPNSAGVAIDSIRCCKLALDNKLKGAIIEPAAYFQKHPPKQIEDCEARELVEKFIDTYGHKDDMNVVESPKQPAKSDVELDDLKATLKELLAKLN